MLNAGSVPNESRILKRHLSEHETESLGLFGEKRTEICVYRKEADMYRVTVTSGKMYWYC